jgi:glyoxylase-like metal-dependent hydrolase (beta-lactamase superfamily II)
MTGSTATTGGGSDHGPLVIGRVEVVVICEGFAPMALAEELPGDHVDWQGERSRHPWAFVDDASWAWHVHAFAVRAPHRLVLVDSGLGSFPPYRPWRSHLDREMALQRAGVDPADVGDVVLTHLHADHAGGVAAADGTPRFPNARVHVHRADRDHFSAERDADGYDAGREIDALDRSGLAVTTEADHEVAAGVRVLHSPGHTPGHRSVLVEDAEDRLLLTGDLLHLPVQVDTPESPSAHDVDPALASDSRTALLSRAGRNGWLVGVSHFAVPFGSVAPAPGQGRWRSRLS